jgi:hypothetical protein
MKMAIFLGLRSEKRQKIKFYFYSKSPHLDVGGFAKGIKKYSPNSTEKIQPVHRCVLVIPFTHCIWHLRTDG